MLEQRISHIPVELMEILNKIHNKVNEVGERIARIEAQDHADVFRIIRADIEKERDHRIALEIELANVKTKLAPIVMGVSMVGAAIVDYLLHFVGK
jgi:uncharacterized transporter YbjL